mgnify:CR=1 FL=1
MTAPTYRHEVLIKEKHLDTMGHMNNATYLQLFEEARWDLITANGFGLKEIQQKKQGPTILEINLRFKKEIRLIAPTPEWKAAIGIE